MTEEAVIIHFEYELTDLDELFVLEDKLRKTIESQGIGEYDGNEIALEGTDNRLYMYGPDANRLYATIRPILVNEPLLKNATALLRYSTPEYGMREVLVRVGE